MTSQKTLLTHRQINIREALDGWESAWTDDPENTLTHHTAADALRHVKQYSATRAEQGVSNAVQINWLPSTRAGRTIVRTLAGR